MVRGLPVADQNGQDVPSPDWGRMPQPPGAALGSEALEGGREDFIGHFGGDGHVGREKGDAEFF